MTETNNPELNIKKLFDGFEWAIGLPAEEFRVETMSLYLELLVGMQITSPEILSQIEVC